LQGGEDTRGTRDAALSRVGLATIDVMTNYVDVGGGTNKPTRYYRVRLVP